MRTHKPFVGAGAGNWPGRFNILVDEGDPLVVWSTLLLPAGSEIDFISGPLSLTSSVVHAIQEPIEHST